MILSNGYFNPASQQSTALLEPLREPLTHNRLKSADVFTRIDTRQGIRIMHYDAVHLEQADAFSNLQNCYKLAMQRARASGAQALLDLAVNVVYLTETQEKRVVLEPQPNIVDLRDLQPIVDLDAET